MKKLYITVIALMAMTFSQAQDITDAVRYSTEGMTGTARYRAMSGAFGALGGDLSAMGVNPAGSAVFLKSFSTITMSYNQRQNQTGYFNGLSANESSDTNFDQAGAVFIFNSMNTENPFGRLAIGFNYANTNNFTDAFRARGTGSSSIDNYFLGYADGLPLELLETIEDETITDLYSYLGEYEGFGAQQAFLGYQGYILEPDANTPENTLYSSTIAPGSFDQDYTYAATGLNGKFTFNLASEFNKVLYLGANLNAHFLNYDRTTRFRETNANPGSETNEVLFSNNLSTTGHGFSVQVGAIANLGNVLRLGGAYESPTWYTLNERSTQRLETNSTLDERVVVNPNVVNIYPDYNLKTPAKLTGSAALLFGTFGLVSFDYSYKDFTTMELRPIGDPEFMYQNDLIANNMRAAATYRGGAEIRLGGLSLRGGYRIEESPYKNETTIGQLEGYSAGLGYNFGSVKLDLAYENATRTDNPQLYPVGLTDTAEITRDLSSFILSLSFGL